MKLIFIFATWIFVVYGVEGCLLLDMAARSLGNLLAPPSRPRPRFIVINTRSRPPRPRPVVVHHTLYRPQRIDYGIAVARPRARPRVVIQKPRESPLLGFLGSIFSPPKINYYGRGEVSGEIPRPKKSPKYRYIYPPRLNGYGYYPRVHRPGNIVISNAKNNQNIKVKNLRRRRKYENSEEGDD